MADKAIYTAFRASDAEQRSYSLGERLNAGKYLFAPDTQEDRKMDTWQQIFSNAVHVVFDNRFFKNRFLTQNFLPKGATQAEKHAAEEQQRLIYRKDQANPRSTLSRLMTAGYWNIFAWLEALALFWVNAATSRYDPLNDSYWSSVGSQIHIGLAAFTYAVAKTINLVATPLTIILLASAAAIFGFTPAVIAFTIAASLAAIFSVIYHRNQSKQTFNGSERFHWLMGIRHLLASIAMGIIQPMVRLYERGRDLYHTNPYLFALAAFVVVVAVLTFAVFPYVGAPAVAGFKLGTFAYGLLNPIMSKMATYFVLNTVQTTIFKSAVAFVATLGVVDLITRGIKEIAGWLNVSKAKDTGAAWEQEHAKQLDAQHKAEQALVAKKELITELQTAFNTFADEYDPNISGITVDAALQGKFAVLSKKYIVESGKEIDTAVDKKIITPDEAGKIKNLIDSKMAALSLNVHGIKAQPSPFISFTEDKSPAPHATPTGSAVPLSDSVEQYKPVFFRYAQKEAPVIIPASISAPKPSRP